MTQFLTQSSPIPPYMAFPRFLLDKDGLNETAKILYTILLDRARLSQKNDGWTDEQGHVFIFFPIKSLAETMHKSEMSVKTALNALEKENLIARKRQGAGFPNRIYVKYPPEALNQTDRIFSVKQTENCPTDGQKTVSVTDRKLSSNGIAARKQNLKKMENALETLEQQRAALSEQKEADKTEFLEIRDGIAPENMDAVMQEREKLRPDGRVGLVRKLYEKYKNKYSSATFDEANRQIDAELKEQPIQKKKRSISEQLKMPKQETPQPKKQKKKEYER